MTYIHGWAAAVWKAKQEKAEAEHKKGLEWRAMVGIWEQGDGVAVRPEGWLPQRVTRAEVAREELAAGRVWDELYVENDGHPGKRQDTIIQRWIQGHGPMEYVMQWRTRIDEAVERLR